MSIVNPSDQHLLAGEFDPTTVLERFGADMSLFAELVDIFLEDYPPLVCEIRRAIYENDANKLKLAAHTLRGAIGNFTVGRPYDVARQLESMAQTKDLKVAENILDALVQQTDQLAMALKRCVSGTVA